MRLYLVGALAAFLVGCGGSSSSSVDKVKLNGVAVDDLIVDGIVKAYPANNPTNVLATGSTDSKGSYTLDVAYDGVVVVEVECKVGKSYMINPANPNNKIDCVDGLKLNSAADVSPDQGSVEVNISPLTELVVRQMKESSNVTEKELTEARNNVQQMFLVDPLAANPTEGDYAKIISAIHEVDKQDDSKNIAQVIDALAEDYKDGTAGDADISGKLATAMEDVGVVNPLTYNKGNFKPEVVDATLSDIELSKKFFNELRTQAISIVDYNDSGTAGFLDMKADDLGADLKTVSLDINTAADIAVKHVVNVLDAIKSSKDDATKDLSSTKSVQYTKTSDSLVWTYSVVESGSEVASGTITLPSENPDNLSLKDFNGTLTAKFDGEVPLSLDDPNETGKQKVKTDLSLTKQDYGSDVKLTDLSVESDTAKISINTLDIKAYYSFDENDEVVMDHVIFDNVTLDANTNKYSFSGTLSIPEYVQNATIKDKGFMIKSENKATPDTVVTQNISRATDNTDDDGFYNSGYLPKKVLFDGEIANSAKTEYLKGKIIVDWLNAAAMSLTNNSNEEDAIVDVSVIGKIKAAERPEMMISLGYTNPNNRSNFKFMYAYDKTIVNGTGAFDKEVDNGTIVLTTLNGIKSTIKVENGDVVYGAQSNVTKDGTVIGTLEDRNGIPVIKYTDGTFESLP